MTPIVEDALSGFTYWCRFLNAIRGEPPFCFSGPLYPFIALTGIETPGRRRRNGYFSRVLPGTGRLISGSHSVLTQITGRPVAYFRGSSRGFPPGVEKRTRAGNRLIIKALPGKGAPRHRVNRNAAGGLFCGAGNPHLPAGDPNRL